MTRVLLSRHFTLRQSNNHRAESCRFRFRKHHACLFATTPDDTTSNVRSLSPLNSLNSTFSLNRSLHLITLSVCMSSSGFISWLGRNFIRGRHIQSSMRRLKIWTNGSSQLTNRKPFKSLLKQQPMRKYTTTTTNTNQLAPHLFLKLPQQQQPFQTRISHLVLCRQA